MLDIRKQSSEIGYCGFVQVIDLNTKHTLLHKPFPKEQIEQAIPLDENRVICLGENSNLAILDGRTGNILHSCSISETFRAGSLVKDMVRCPAHGAIALMGTYEILLVSDRDLSTIFQADAVLWNGSVGSLMNTREMPQAEQERFNSRYREASRPVDTSELYFDTLRFADFARERDDGLIVAGFRENDLSDNRSQRHPNDLAQRTGFYFLDIANETIRRIEIDKCYDRGFYQEFVSADPTGRWALRRGFRQIPHQNASLVADLFNRLRGRRKEYRHPDLRHDGKDRFLMSFELWNLQTGSHVRNLEVFWMEIADAAEAARWKQASAMLARLDKPFYRHQPKDLTQPPGRLFQMFFKKLGETFKRQHWLWQSAWETSGDALWLTHTDGLRRIGVDGSVSPLVRFDGSDRQKQHGTRGFWNHRLREVVRSGDLFAIRNEHCILHVPTEAVSRKTREVWVSEAEARVTVLDDTTNRDLTTRETLHLTGHVVELLDLSEQASRSALATLSRDISKGFSTILGGSQYSHTFEPAFRYADALLTEAEFFDLALEHGWDLRDECRTLLMIWLDELERKDLGLSFYTGISGGTDATSGYEFGGLGQAMKYLVFTDASCLDVFRTYLSRRDGEHEIFSAEILGQMYIDRYGYSSPDIYRFGIFWVATRYSDGCGPVEALWNKLGLLDAASESMAPVAFADLVLEELGAFNAKWGSSDHSIGAVLDGLKRLLPGNGDWADQLLSEIERRDFDGSRRAYRSPLAVSP
ncbi:hypothetical protein [Stappia indica]|uniref:hypothetical protein n=1 Tax=Stappia indica TaxID=538381 RepID=UPI001111C9C7|nr:hypothetical protein [Stappia indica]